MGDRFESSRRKFVIEVIELDGQFGHNEIVVTNDTLSIDYEIGHVGSWGIEHPYWIYLGNFSKSRNFSNLYELLNEPQ